MELWKELWVADEKWLSHQEGEREGELRGKIEGKLQEKINIIKKMCKKSTLAELADIVELSEEIVEAVITALKKEPEKNIQELIHIISPNSEGVLVGA